MNNENLQRIIEKRIERIREVLEKKNAEYAGASRDKLHNFKVGAMLLGCTPETALLGYMTKHLVSIVDLVHDLECGTNAPTDRWREKIGDAINYLILLEALVEERKFLN